MACNRFNPQKFAISAVVAISLACVGFALLFTFEDPNRIHQCGQNATCSNQIVGIKHAAVINYTIAGCHIYEYRYGKTCDDFSNDDNSIRPYLCYLNTDPTNVAQCVPNRAHASDIIAALVIIGIVGLYGMVALATSVIFLICIRDDFKPYV